ncbi:uncharacterized protein DS421_5g158210 [Arachis hypogaea]|nr:uncharacterized protein DS421_5g158210 [Arachis hypogaea]
MLVWQPLVLLLSSQHGLGDRLARAVPLVLFFRGDLAFQGLHLIVELPDYPVCIFSQVVDCPAFVRSAIISSQLLLVVGWLGVDDTGYPPVS